MKNTNRVEYGANPLAGQHDNDVMTTFDLTKYNGFFDNLMSAFLTQNIDASLLYFYNV
ncbi:hypothetical protein C7445_102235 [Alicyclobacillus sacchari]|uniref:Uncharacterized protein n=1 Tax=Alicyclobacillus sacchari TaxID=392010 RepID=A0A4R8LV33_9BACL|nr:hypothetical protein C7445_102235 [Alicyclobacillus sacchari]